MFIYTNEHNKTYKDKKEKKAAENSSEYTQKRK